MIDLQLQKKLPFSFWMEDLHEHPAIYIVDEDFRLQQRLTLQVENTLDSSLYFEPIDLDDNRLPTAENCHFELRFRKGVLADSSLGHSKNKLLEHAKIETLLSGKYKKQAYQTGSWAISDPDESEGRPYVSFYLTRAGKETAGEFAAGERLKMVLTNISASPDTGARETRVEMLPRKVYYLPELTEESRVKQPREQPLQVINHLGKEHIPLHTAFVGPNTVLNDGRVHGAGYSLNLRISNISKHDPISFKKNSRIIFEFEFADGDVKEALGTAGNLEKIQFLMEGTPLQVPDGEEMSRNPHWLLTEENHLADQRIDPHKHWDIEVRLDEFATTSPAGLTLLKIKYENVPGYWDGELHAVVEKSPLLVKQEGNAVKLDTGVRPAYFTGKVGAGTSNPAVCLALSDNLNEKGMLKLHNEHNEANDQWWLGFTHGFDDNSDFNDRARIGVNIKEGGHGRLIFMTGHRGTQQERLRIDENGNVGIGDPSPTSPLFVKVQGNQPPDQQGLMVYNNRNESGQDACIAARVGGSGAGNPYISLDIHSEAGYSMGIDNSDGNKLKIKSFWHFSGANDDYTRLTIQPDGNVGIGTPDPLAKLDVHGKIRTWNKDHGSAIWDNMELWSEGEKSFIEANGAEQGLFISAKAGNGTGTKIELQSNGGKVVIGTAAVNANLEVNGSVGCNYLGADNMRINQRIECKELTIEGFFLQKKSLHISVVNKNFDILEMHGAVSMNLLIVGNQILTQDDVKHIRKILKVPIFNLF